MTINILSYEYKTIGHTSPATVESALKGYFSISDCLAFSMCNEEKSKELTPNQAMSLMSERYLQITCNLSH